MLFVHRSLLDEVDKDVTRVQDKLTNGMKRVAWVIKKNEGEDERFIPSYRGILIQIVRVQKLPHRAVLHFLF